MSMARRCALVVSLALLLVYTLRAQAASPQPVGWGTHGMAVFGGREGLYASHLPMFHAPHDAQVVLRFHLEDVATDRQLREELAEHPELWTLEPEAFDLKRLEPGHALPLRHFRAGLFKGHFERGGIERFADQRVNIDTVLIFQTLAPPSVPHSEGRYRLIGAGREHFLVKVIDRRPDFDMLLALRPTPAFARARTLLLPSNDLSEPPIAILNAALSAQIGAEFAVRKTLYFETDDLR